MDSVRLIAWCLTICLLLLIGLSSQPFPGTRPSFPAHKESFASITITRQPIDHRLPQRQPHGATWDAEPAFPGLRVKNPIHLVPVPSMANEYFLLERQGRVVRFRDAEYPPQQEVVLDLSPRLPSPLNLEQGLLGLTFHPNFGRADSPQRDQIFVFYAGRDGNRLFNRLSRFPVDRTTMRAQLEQEVVLIDQTDPDAWHNAGCLQFGSDGFLYVAVGDGGGLNDQFGNAQRIDRGLFSGILRLDVDCRGGEVSHPPPRQPTDGRTADYFIPSDNPFVGQSDVLEEFWSLGLRNPHRIAFDPQTDELWVADVGTMESEEINIARPGSNHQWSYREGTQPFHHSRLHGKPPTDRPGIDTPPLYAYPQVRGNHCASEGYCVIGGFVYRGEKHPSLVGKYVFGDYGSGKIWSLERSSDSMPTVEELLTIPSSGNHRLASIATDAQGEIFFLIGPDADEYGEILKLVPADGTEQLPARLSETGLFVSLDPIVPHPGLVPYEINVPFWSSGADKSRWVGLPINDKVRFDQEEPWEFPAGTVFVKHFTLPGAEGAPERKLETRVLVRDDRGGIYGATYRWQGDGVDAVLVDRSGLTEPVAFRVDGRSEELAYRFPSRTECLLCHNRHGGPILGLNCRQLNRTIHDAIGRKQNQLQMWIDEGLLSDGPSSTELEQLPRLPNPRDRFAALADRVGAYLDANCSYCHRPGAEIRAWFDLRYQTKLSAKSGLQNGNVCQPLDIAGPDQKVVVPGQPHASVLYQRFIHRDTEWRMPPVGNSVIDAEAARWIREWIESLEPAP
jgi:uncharacterized repeat protein (TIGR03806 family)